MRERESGREKERERERESGREKERVKERERRGERERKREREGSYLNRVKIAYENQEEERKPR